MDAATKQKISQSTATQFKGHTPWNKGKVGAYNKELIQQWSQKHKDINSSEEFRIKMSCSKRNILPAEFTEFSSSMQERERAQIKSLGLNQQAFERDDFTCQSCSMRGVHFHAHHMNGFDKFPEQRFQLSNLITLCKDCHTMFHAEYKKGNNTKEQIVEFLSKRKK